MSPICDVIHSEASEAIQILPLDPLAKSEKKSTKYSLIYEPKNVSEKKKTNTDQRVLIFCVVIMI